jgi:hypothetical protein
MFTPCVFVSLLRPLDHSNATSPLLLDESSAAQVPEIHFTRAEATSNCEKMLLYGTLSAITNDASPGRFHRTKNKPIVARADPPLGHFLNCTSCTKPCGPVNTGVREAEQACGPSLGDVESSHGGPSLWAATRKLSSSLDDDDN